MAVDLYPFLLNMWISKRISESNIQNAVTKQWITPEEANMILATTQKG